MWEWQKILYGKAKFTEIERSNLWKLGEKNPMNDNELWAIKV